jgi:hypothetical protein
VVSNVVSKRRLSGCCGHAAAVALCGMPKPHVSLRVHVPLELYEKVGEYRHAARHDTKNQALVTLVAAGLAALAKPPAAVPSPDRPRKLIPFAGAEPVIEKSRSLAPARATARGECRNAPGGRPRRPGGAVAASPNVALTGSAQS